MENFNIDAFNILTKVLNYLGFNIVIDKNSSPILLICGIILFAALLCLWCFINIMLYMVSLYVIETKYFLDKISKYPLLLKLLKYYRHIRVAYIIFEVFGVFVFCFKLGGIIYFCVRIISMFIIYILLFKSKKFQLLYICNSRIFYYSIKDLGKSLMDLKSPL